MNYRGRFAPSPTGPLHFGSLIAAVGSYLEARRNRGEWLVRIEDIDDLRCKPEWSDTILRTLETFGFEWDGAPVYQSRRMPLYQDALDYLASRGFIYPCGCTRKEIADSNLSGIEETVYPGTCRQGLAASRRPRTLRLRTNSATICFVDAVQGENCQSVENAIGDFVVRRADGPVAYQLAVVVDDSQQGITHVVRGADLLSSTPRQIHLQRLLDVPTPQYMHLPVAVNKLGEKLSKQTGAAPVNPRQVAEILAQSLIFLGHVPPQLPLKELWEWAFIHWQPTNIPRQFEMSIAQKPF